MVKSLGNTASSADKNNVAFLSSFLMGNLEDCLDTLIKSGRLPEAAFFARTYLPSEVNRVLPLWKAELAKVNEKAGQSLADPENYENLFPNFAQSLEAQKHLENERKVKVPANRFLSIPVSIRSISTQTIFNPIFETFVGGRRVLTPTFQNINYYPII